jgi:hypothetical protein
MPSVAATALLALAAALSVTAEPGVARAGTFPLWAAPMAAAPTGEPGLLCRAAIRQAEQGAGLPPHLLAGIAHVESGRADPVTGRVHPWPWTVNAEGRGSFFDTKAQAIAFVRGLQARGVASFDVGCMQINMMHHPDAFASLEEAFDPVANARYAVKFLTQLKQQTGSWDTATADYHSATPELGIPYRGMVVTAMAKEADGGNAGDAPMPGAIASGGMPFAAALPSMPSRPGMTMLLAHAPGGQILPLPGMRSPGLPAVASAGAAGPGAPAGGVFGRGLDSYRSHPVAVIAPRMLAAR